MISTEAQFVGCNKELQIFDYNPEEGNIAYGAQNAVAVSSPFLKEKSLDAKVTRILKGHRALVTAVKWVPAVHRLISASQDGTVKIWRYDAAQNYVLEQTLVPEPDHNGSITCIDSVTPEIFLTGNATGYVDIWQAKEKGYEQFAHFQVASGVYPLAISSIEIRPGQFVVFVGGTKPILFVYTFELSDPSSVKSGAVLTGHEDWIRTLAVKEVAPDEYLIASGSQDQWIRLWKLGVNNKMDNSDTDSSQLRLLSNKIYKFSVAATTKCAVTFDAIIMGHDDWISDLQWHPSEMKLVSSSADSSVMVWQPDPASGVWISKVRLGEMAIKGASTATGSAGGFWAAQWIVNGDNEIILTNGKTGSFRCWVKQDDTEFRQNPCLTGAVRSATDVQWSDSGSYLLATSLDQTTRLFTQWKQTGSWHEFSRAQIHGYDMICCKPLSESRFVSAGDEKVIRVFDEPRSVAQMLDRLTDVKETQDEESRPESASLPVLGLSNKAELGKIEQHLDEEADDPAGSAQVQHNGEGPATANGVNLLQNLDTPPLEDLLQRHTLWPEVEKLYGHGFEVTTLDVSPDKSLVASACRSNTAKHAVIRIFRTSNWQQLDQVLAGHELTITRVRWSPDGRYLLAVSRDRQFTLWKREGEQFTLVHKQEKAHNRILWDCCWVAGEECTFVTASRDRRMKAWKFEADKLVWTTSSERLSGPVTSLDSSEHHIIAAGLDSGAIELYSLDPDGEFTLTEAVDKDLAPGGNITRISFRPGHKQFAVASEDSSVRIYNYSV